MKKSMHRLLGYISTGLLLFASLPAQAWVGVGIGVTAPVYAYPAPAYYPPPPPPPAYPYAYYPAPAYPAPAAAPQAPVSAYNEDCREYSRNVVIDGHTQHVYGHACRQPDGVWKIMD